MKTTNLSAKTYIPIMIITGIIAFSVNFSKGGTRKKMHTHKNNSTDASIVGTWISNTDPEYKLVFPDVHTCMEYDSTALQETDSVIISNTSPQCGITVPITANTTYMQFINKANHSDHLCYEIIGLTDTSLMFRSVDLMHPRESFHR